MNLLNSKDIEYLYKQGADASKSKTVFTQIKVLSNLLLKNMKCRDYSKPLVIMLEYKRKDIEIR